MEEKWVAAPEGMSFTKEEIYRQVEFQEKFFDSEVRMWYKTARSRISESGLLFL